MKSRIILIAEGYSSWWRYYAKCLKKLEEFDLLRIDTVDGLMEATNQYQDRIVLIVVADDLSQINTIETTGSWIQKLRERGWAGQVVALTTNCTIEEILNLNFTVAVSSREFIPAAVRSIVNQEVEV